MLVVAEIQFHRVIYKDFVDQRTEIRWLKNVYSVFLKDLMPVIELNKAIKGIYQK